MPFNFYLTAISRKDTKKANPESALGIQLMMLAQNIKYFNLTPISMGLEVAQCFR